MLVVVFILLSVVLPFLLFVLHLGAAACGDACDTTTSGTSFHVFLVFDGILFVTVMVPFVLRTSRWERAWWLPATGIAALLVGALIAYVVIRIALPVL